MVLLVDARDKLYNGGSWTTDVCKSPARELVLANLLKLLPRSDNRDWLETSLLICDAD